MMTTICAFCLSNDRILTIIDEKYWKIVDFCINTSEDQAIEYLQCLQRKQALQICWECSTKLKKIHQFISTSQQCVRVLKTYLDASTQILPPTTSNLYRTNLEIIDVYPKYKEFKAEEETHTETETEDIADTVDTWPILGETETKDVTETLDVKMENDSFETLLATKIDIVETDPELKTEIEETEAFDVTKTLDVKIEFDSLETELNDIPDSNNGKVINSDIREDPCTSVDLQMIKEQVLPTATLQANIMSSGASVSICDGTNNSRIKAIEDVPRGEALHEVTDCISKQQTTKHNETNISKKNKVISKTTLFKIPEQKKRVSLCYICDLCQQKFYTKMKLQQHISIHHGVSEVNLTCQTCNYKGFTVQALENHSRLHDEKRRFKCNSCTYRFSSNRDLMLHVQTHTREKQHKCDLCDYAGSQSGDLKIHMRTHTGEKPYKCDLCDYASIRSGGLKKHMRKHTGEKQYKCDLCDYASSSSSHLRTHMRIHTGEKPYKCDLCDYRSSKSGPISRHKKRLHAASSAT